MSFDVSSVYEFAFRGLLTEQALDSAGRVDRRLLSMPDEVIAEKVALSSLDDIDVANAKSMGIVYTAIAAFENSVRSLVVRILMDKHQEKWWDDGVSENTKRGAQRKMESEQSVKWHSQRGTDPINYTTFGDLRRIMEHNWDVFEPHINDLDWAKSIFDVIERSRNVIMHSGNLAPEDIERIGVNIRDWVRQVGS